MGYDNASDMKYISDLDEIPVTGQGIDRGWPNDEKLDAAQAGEDKLEGDVNNGNQITGAESIHEEAAATWATYKLVLGMKVPDSATRGDSLDEGTERMAFADRLKSMYYDLVDTINDASGDAGDSGGTTFRTFDYNP